jgi:hypothetical protein
MKLTTLLAAALLSLAPAQAQAQAQVFELGGYQQADGAITVTYRGDTVDPYFAIRALLTARQAGLDTEASTRAWIAWLLPRQDPDGRFARYCRQAGQSWRTCRQADADDALLAMWIELLQVAAPHAGLPPDWARSAALAQRHLARLREPVLGVYLIAADNRVALFMDNLEIHAALMAIGQRQQGRGEHGAARATLAGALQLRGAIGRVFRPSGSGLFRVSTQPQQAPRFYPDHVAQLYPVLLQFPQGQPPRQVFRQWIAEHGSVWLGQQADTYPWGLVALAARLAGDAGTAYCWKSKAAHLRFGARWNVLEEAVFQSITLDGPETGAVCVPVNESAP